MFHADSLSPPSESAAAPFWRYKAGVSTVLRGVQFDSCWGKSQEKIVKEIADRLAKEASEEEEKRRKGAAIAPPAAFE
uniref:Uncharacterized protein n=1 Tax=Globodera rostochiensis TaxID=31243 RepID=A0A914HBU8_GLORO